MLGEQDSRETIGRRFHILQSSDAEGKTCAAVAPDWGANVIAFGFWPEALRWPIPVLEPVDLATTSMSPTSFGMPLLAPTPGEVGKGDSGRFEYQGRQYLIKPSRHGLFRQVPWSVITGTTDSIECSAEVRVEEEDELFPFHLIATHRVEVRPRSLRSIVRLRNLGDRLQPANVGWHPYLYRPENCVLRLPAASYWEFDADPQPRPTGKILPVTGRFDFMEGRELGDEEHWDHAFTDLIAANNLTTCSITGCERLLTKLGTLAECRISREVEIKNPSGEGDASESETRRITNVQLYTPPGRKAVCIEPFSCPPDAINLLARGCAQADVVELAPGQEAAFEMELRITVAY